MTLQERIDSTERKVDEVCKQGCDTTTVRYWVGYLDGLIAVLRDQNKEAARALAEKGEAT